MEKKKRMFNGLLLAAVVVSFLLRVFHLAKESLWVDEGFTYQLAQLGLGQYIDNVLHSLRNILPPLYFFLMHQWTQLFGYSEFSLRFPSVLFGTGSVVAIGMLGRKLFNERVGLISASVLALSVFHMHYSQEARMYAMLGFFAILSFSFLVSFLERRRLTDIGMLTATNSMLVYTHHYGFFVVGAQAMYVVLAKVQWNKAKYVMLSFFATGAALFPWVSVMENQVAKVYRDPWLKTPDAYSIGKVLVEFCGSPFLLIGMLAMMFLGFLKMKKRKEPFFHENPMLLLLVWMLIPFVFSLAYSFLVSPIFSAKYLLFSSIPLYILVAAGVDSLERKYRAIALACIGILSLMALFPYYMAVQKEQWREATDFVEKRTRSNDLVLFNAGFGLRNGFAYYAQRSDLDLRPFPEKTQEINAAPTLADLSLLKEITMGRNSVWVVFSHSLDKEYLMVNTLGRNYPWVSRWDFESIVVYLFEQ